MPESVGGSAAGAAVAVGSAAGAAGGGSAAAGGDAAAVGGQSAPDGDPIVAGGNGSAFAGTAGHLQDLLTTHYVGESPAARGPWA